MLYGTPSWTQTSDLLIRNQILYSAELWAQRLCSIEYIQGACFFKLKCLVGVAGVGPAVPEKPPPAYKAGALTAELYPWRW